MPRLPGGWEDLPDEVRERLTESGMERAWKGLGGPDVPAMRQRLEETDWEAPLVAGMSWDTAVTLDAWGMEADDFGDVASYRIGCQDDHWYGTFTFEDGSERVIDFGSESASAWDVWDYCAILDIDTERGDIDYSEV